jgi:hypothetical protein
MASQLSKFFVNMGFVMLRICVDLRSSLTGSGATPLEGLRVLGGFLIFVDDIVMSKITQLNVLKKGRVVSSLDNYSDECF